MVANREGEDRNSSGDEWGSSSPRINELLSQDRYKLSQRWWDETNRTLHDKEYDASWQSPRTKHERNLITPSFDLGPSETNDSDLGFGTIGSGAQLAKAIPNLQEDLKERTNYRWPDFVSKLLRSFLDIREFAGAPALLTYKRAAHTRSHTLRQLWEITDFDRVTAPRFASAEGDIIEAIMKRRSRLTKTGRVRPELPRFEVDIESWQREQPSNEWYWDGTLRRAHGEERIATAKKKRVLCFTETIIVPNTAGYAPFQTRVRVPDGSGGFLGDRNISLAAAVVLVDSLSKGQQAEAYTLGIRVDPESFATVSMDFGAVSTRDMLMTYYGEATLLRAALDAKA